MKNVSDWCIWEKKICIGIGIHCDDSKKVQKTKKKKHIFCLQFHCEKSTTRRQENDFDERLSIVTLVTKMVIK